MNDEIKEIKTIGQLLDYVETEAKAKELIDYITNLQQRIYKARKMIFDNYGLDKDYPYTIEEIERILLGE